MAQLKSTNISGNLAVTGEVVASSVNTDKIITDEIVKSDGSEFLTGVPYATQSVVGGAKIWADGTTLYIQTS